MHRLFDSQDILSTVARRLDLAVLRGVLKAETPGQLWEYVHSIADNALVDRGRLFARLERTEGRDGPIASRLRGRLQHGDQDGDAAVDMELDSLISSLDDGTDRQILSLWLHDVRHGEIARDVGMTPSAVRKRWQRIRTRLETTLSSED